MTENKLLDPDLCANGAARFCFACCRECELIYQNNKGETVNETTLAFINDMINGIKIKSKTNGKNTPQPGQ